MQQGMAPIVPMHEPRVLTARNCQLLFTLCNGMRRTYSCFHTSREHLDRSRPQESEHSWAGDPLFAVAQH